MQTPPELAELAGPLASVHRIEQLVAAVKGGTPGESLGATARVEKLVVASLSVRRGGQ